MIYLLCVLAGVVLGYLIAVGSAVLLIRLAAHVIVRSMVPMFKQAADRAATEKRQGRSWAGAERKVVQ